MGQDAGLHALYEGTVWHHRREPEHRFRQRVTMAWLDLDHLDQAAIAPWSGSSAFSPVQLRRSDFFGDAALTAADAVRARVECELGVRPEGSVHILANLRTWGWCFNPLAVYWCHDAEGKPVAELLVVTNTPWHEQHVYVVDRRSDVVPGPVTLQKAMHVSPFFPMNFAYHLTDAEPDERASVRLDLFADRGAGPLVFSAGFEGRRRPFDAAGLRRLLWRTPTQRVSIGIHVHALRLWRKGATFYRHPNKVTQTNSGGGSHS